MSQSAALRQKPVKSGAAEPWRRGSVARGGGDAGTRAELRAIIRKVYGDRLVRALLFGSRVRGTAGPDSGGFLEESAYAADASLQAFDAGHDLQIVGLTEDDFRLEESFYYNLRREGVPL